MGLPVQKNRRSSSSLPVFLVFLLTIILLEKSVSSISALEHYPNGKQPSKSRLRRIQKYLAKINKPAVLTIESPDGDIIDCVDKWKQPSFDHPLLKNHTLQLAPSRWLPFGKENEKRGEEVEFSKRVAAQVWHLNGTSCPEDTVPIRRTTVTEVLMARHHFMRKRPSISLPRSNVTISPDDDRPPGRHEYAVVRADGTAVFGASAAINLWNPSLGDALEMSLAQIWLYHLPPDPAYMTILEAGWHVYPNLYGDDQTRLFVFWTSDYYKSTGCYNLRCLGFVQTGSFIVPGAALTPTSVINGQQYDGTFNLYQDPRTGNWWLTYGWIGATYEVGYFAAEAIPLMKNGGNGAHWGGEVANMGQNAGRRGQHTLTQMGSGRFAHDQFGLAAYFRGLYVLAENGNQVSPQITSHDATYPSCYSITAPTWDSPIPDMGLHFYYGGNGGASPDCVQ